MIIQRKVRSQKFANKFQVLMFLDRQQLTKPSYLKVHLVAVLT